MTKKPKQSLEGWVKESTGNVGPRVPPRFVQKPAPVAPKADVYAPKATTRYITLNEWAVSQFSRVPHYNTLIRWGE